MSDPAPPTVPAAPTVSSRRVDLPGGPVTLEPLDQLRKQLTEQEGEAHRLLQEAAAASSAAEQKLQLAGGILLDRSAEWAQGAVADQIQPALQLRLQITSLHAQSETLKSRPHSGLGGLFQGLSDDHHEHTLEKEASKLSQGIDAALLELLPRLPDRTLPEADSLRAEAAALKEQAAALTVQAQAVSSQAGAVSAEVGQRQAALKSLGFDSLLLAAELETDGPQPVSSPLALKAKEQAYYCTHAVLARLSTRTTYAGRSQGVSFPIGHTGIRYRVGSFSGHPVQTTALTDLDQGSLVVTGQRLAFIGSTRSVVTALAKIVHVESYTDALAVFQEGRERPNLYKLETPQRVLLYLNWALAHIS
ncbi:MAG TPA: hypothetical protein VNI34_08885 [Candidatus Nitrosotalea sp.]|nr:hypothetical protein [Candidatus Nitrosotalea sp.]